MNRIKELLNEKRMSQRELAELVGVDENTISRYVVGTRTPTPEYQKRVARALQENVDYVFGRSDERCKDRISRSSLVMYLDELWRTQHYISKDNVFGEITRYYGD